MPRILSMTSFKRRAFVAASLLAISPLCALASPIIFSGGDHNAGPSDPRPNSSAAQASYLAAAATLGPVSTINFESAPVGSFTTLTVAPGVTITSTTSSVANTTNYPPNPSLGGFNTTPGGTNYVEIDSGSLVFNFATPVQSFGAYISGVQLSFYNDVITFSDGTAQSIFLPGTSDGTGYLDFVGFTDAGKSITSVTIMPGSGTFGDYVGIDDVSFVTNNTTVTPEPSSFALLLTAFGSLGAGYRRLTAKRNA